MDGNGSVTFEKKSDFHYQKISSSSPKITISNAETANSQTALKLNLIESNLAKQNSIYQCSKPFKSGEHFNVSPFSPKSDEASHKHNDIRKTRFVYPENLDHISIPAQRALSGAARSDNKSHIRRNSRFVPSGEQAFGSDIKFSEEGKSRDASTKYLKKRNNLVSGKVLSRNSASAGILPANDYGQTSFLSRSSQLSEGVPESGHQSRRRKSKSYFQSASGNVR